MTDKEAPMGLDYSQFEIPEEINTSDVLGQITVLVDQLIEKDKEIAHRELEMKRLKARRDGIAEKDLPELMQSVGMTALTTKSGYPIKLEKVLHTNISKDRKAPAIAWLDQHGHGGIVKREVIVSFSKCEEAKVKSLLRLIGKQWKNHKTVLDVNAASVKALIRKLMDDGAEVDREIFGVHEIEVVKISSK